MGQNPTSEYTLLNNTTTNASTYKGQIDSNSVVAARIVDFFAPHQSATPNMTVTVDAGAVFNGASLTEVTQQVSGTITAPTGSNKRIDRAVIDAFTGALSIITGTPTTGTPTPPAITAGTIPVAQIGTTSSPLVSTTTTITDSMITDERCMYMLGSNWLGGAGTMASAATVDLGSVNNAYISITGTTAITSFGSSMLPGQRKMIEFAGALTLTYNATSMILPGGANITTAAGDLAYVICISAGNYRVMYMPANGSTIGGVNSISAGTGITVGGTTNVPTVGITNTAVTPGSYMAANITVNQQGQITAASNGLSGALTLLNTVNASSAGSVSFGSTYITGSYSKYIVEIDSLYLSSASGLQLTFSTNNGSTYITTNYAYNGISMTSSSSTVTGANGTGIVDLALGTGFASGASSIIGEMTLIFSNLATSKTPLCKWTGSSEIAGIGGGMIYVQGGVGNSGTTAINNIKFSPGAGNITGNFKLYGVS